MGTRTVDLTKGQLTEDELLTAANAFAEMVGTQGWALLIQLVTNSKYAITQMIHDPDVTKDYLSGLLKAIETIPDNVTFIIEKGEAIKKQRQDERTAEKKAMLPFVRPGGSTPAN
jgi:hypothetical protein